MGLGKPNSDRLPSTAPAMSEAPPARAQSVVDNDEDTAPVEVPALSALDRARQTLDNVADKSSWSGGAETASADSDARSRSLEALLKISQAINSTLDLDRVLELVMRHAVELLQAQRGFLMLLDDENQLVVRTAHKIDQATLDSEENLRISRSVANRVAATGRSEYTSNAMEDPRFAGQQSVQQLNLRFIMCVPLKVSEKVIGVCYVDNQAAHRIFGKTDLRLFEVYAEQAAIAIENAKLYGELLALKSYHESVVSETPVGLVVVDDLLRVTTFNAAAERILLSPDALHGGDEMVESNLPFLDLWDFQERGWWEESLATARKSGAPVTKDRHFVSIGGEEKVLSIKISPFEAQGDIPRRIVIVAEDITEKTTLENFLAFSQKMVAKGEMAAAIGHELNNYLHILSAQAELMPLYLKREQHDKLREASEQIQSGVTRMVRFTDGLQKFSNPDLDLVECDLRAVVEEHLFSIRPLHKYSQVQFGCTFEPGLPMARIDAGQIQQVLLNLYNNAIDASGPTRPIPIDVGVRRSDDRQSLVVTVSDHGHGIPEDVRARLFEERITTKKTGHGLGLRNCKRIIENHGGTIAVESTAGEGTTFSFNLPVTAPYDSFRS